MLYCLLERGLVFDLQSLTLATSRLPRFTTLLEGSNSDVRAYNTS
jgi:hypothetical protein